jgi:tight adherence protein C
LFTLGIFAAFIAVFVVAMVVGDVVVERQRVFKMLRGVRTIEIAPTDIRRRELAVPFFKRVAIPALRSATGFIQRLTPAGVVERLRKEVVYAGSPVGWDAERILAMKLVSIAVGVVGTIVLGKVGKLSNVQTIVLVLLGLFVGYYLPEWILRSKSGKRQGQIRRALPDALDLLSITVEAGLGFDAAMARVARQAGGPLGEEMHRVLQEMQIGKSRSEALRDLGERSSVPELKSFVLAMVQADIFGVSIAKVLHVQANEMRIKRRQRAEEAAQKVPVKIIFPLILCIFPALFVVLLGPAAITIYHNIINRPGGGGLAGG